MSDRQEALRLTRLILVSLQDYRAHWTTRLARKIDLAEKNLLHGSIRKRLGFCLTVFFSLCRRRAIFLSTPPTVDVPIPASVALLNLLEQPRCPSQNPSVPADHFTSIDRLLRPHGTRRVAILTNQLLGISTEEPTFGGGERYCLTLAELLRSLGLEVHLFQISMRPYVKMHNGFPLTGLGRGWDSAFAEFGSGNCSAFTDLTRDFDHVVHNLPELASGHVREDAIVICHGLWFDHNNFPSPELRTPEWYDHLGRAFSSGRALVSVDNNSIAFIRAVWPAVAPRAKLIPNFFDPSRFYPKAPPNKDLLNIVFPRRANINRGSRLVPEILRHISANVRFHWVGEGCALEGDLLRKLAHKDPRFEFHQSDFDNMNAWYWKSDITVIPTIGSEGTSLSCLEALACGNPVVTTRVGGLPEIVRDGYNGLVVDPTAESVAQGINYLIHSPEERARLRQIAPASVEGFNVRLWRRRWTDLLVELDWVKRPAIERVSYADHYDSVSDLMELGD